MTENTPAIVEDVSDQADSLSDTLERLSEFRETVTTYQERVENMGENEQDAFYQSANLLRNEAEKATTPEELLALEDDIEEAVRSPLQQVAEESLEALLDLIQPNISEEVRSQTFEKLESKIPLELDRARTAYLEIYKTVDGFSETLKNVLAAIIENDYSLLQSPEQDLKPTIKQLETRRDTLKSLETVFEGSGDWRPSLDFVNIQEFYSNRSTEIEISEVENKIESITTSVNTIEDGGIPVGDIVSEKLKSWYETGDLDQLVSILRDIDDGISSTADSYEDVTESMEELEDYDLDGGMFQTELDELQSMYTQLELHSYSSVGDLEDSIEELSIQIGQFHTQLHQRLKAQVELVDKLDVEESESPPEVHLGTEDSALLPMDVKDNPAQALDDCSALHEWITTHLKADSETVNQDQLITIWQSISGGDEVQVTEENRETILTLADRLPLSVVLSGT
ncbi:hypothetical protein [Natrinema amylolyticum]|uniref:hypothetical protein n=1 Tax=Natrinema amylolyticum TaxID=2878679 RepID=UPI001CF9BB2F|nr:hypothetical protein [Natrinema amylolyticum]